jgi:hypothetical protein
VECSGKCEIIRIAGADAYFPHAALDHVVADLAEPERDRDETLMAQGFAADFDAGDGFGRLADYEARLSRVFFRCLDELGQLQDRRRADENRNSNPA